MKTIDEINTLLKMFGIDAKVTHIPRNTGTPYHLQGILNGHHQGMSRATLAEIEEIADSFMSDRAKPTLVDTLKAQIERDKK